MNTTYKVKAKDPVVVIELLDEVSFTFSVLGNILKELEPEFGKRKIMFIDTVDDSAKKKIKKIIIVFEF